MPPAEFDYDATGPHGPVLSAGRPLWRAYVDLLAPSPKLVLIQSSALAEADHYPVALLRDLREENVTLAVSFKLLAGSLAMGAGVLWRAQDQDRYTAVLVDGATHRLRLVRMTHGSPVELAQARAAFDEKAWNTVEVSAHGDCIAVWLNDQLILEPRDQAPPVPGRVGLLTHADTVAVFDDFYIQSRQERIVRKVRPGAEALTSPALHVIAISTVDADFRTPRSAFRPGARIFWQVQVADQTQKPVAGATVECELVRPGANALGSEKAMAGSDGRTLLSVALPPETPPGKYEVRVRTIAHSGLPSATYDPSANLQSSAQFEVRAE